MLMRKKMPLYGAYFWNPILFVLAGSATGVGWLEVLAHRR